MLILENILWDNLVSDKSLEKYKLTIEYTDIYDNEKNERFSYPESIYISKIKTINKAVIGHRTSWKNVTDIITEKLKETKIDIDGISDVNHKLLSKYNVKTGVVITTHGYYGVYVRQCLNSFLRELPSNRYIVLFINETDDEVTLQLKDDIINNVDDKYKDVTVVHIEDQDKYGGLTATWNNGIDMCLKNSCDIVVLSNDDILFDKCVNNILWHCYDNKKDKYYYGPITNKPGPAHVKNNLCQYGEKPINIKNKTATFKDRVTNLNGFFMVFKKNILIDNKFDEHHYFDPSKPFGGNETEWHNRFVSNGGKPIIVSQTFIYHYKIARWRSDHTLNSKCIYTINTGSYESNNIYLRKSNIDTLYFSDNFGSLYKCISHDVVPFYVEIINENPKLTQRTIKTNPYGFLPHNYERSLYVDGTIELTNITTVNELLDMEDYDVISFKHPDRDKIIDECECVISLNLESEEKLEKLLNHMKKDGFHENMVGLTETNVLFRNHNKIDNFNKDWEKYINISNRDQLSFDFLLNKHKINYIRKEYKDKTDFTKKYKHTNPNRRNYKSFNKLDFIDIGCSKGGSYRFIQKKFKYSNGIAIDIDSRKVKISLENKIPAIKLDASQMNIFNDNACYLISIVNVLQYLPNINTIENMLKESLRVASKTIYIKGPMYYEDYLSELGFHFFWSYWKGITYLIEPDTIISIMKKYNINNYELNFQEKHRVLNSNNPCIHSINGLIDRHDYDETIDPPKKMDVVFEKKLYREFELIFHL